MILLVLTSLVWSEPSTASNSSELFAKNSIIEADEIQLTNGELNIESDSFLFDMKQKRAIFTENVRVKHPNFSMQAHKVVVYGEAKKDKKFV